MSWSQELYGRAAETQRAQGHICLFTLNSLNVSPMLKNLLQSSLCLVLTLLFIPRGLVFHLFKGI